MLPPTKLHYSERSEKATGEYLIFSSLIKTPWQRLKHEQSVMKLKLNTFSLHHHGVRPDPPSRGHIPSCPLLLSDDVYNHTNTAGSHRPELRLKLK